MSEYVQVRFNRPDNPSANLTPEAVQAIVDSFVTPKTIQFWMKCVKLEPGANAPDTLPAGPAPFPIDRHYESPDVYAIDIYLSQVQTPDNRMTLLFERDGWFGWKMTAIRFSWT